MRSVVRSVMVLSAGIVILTTGVAASYAETRTLKLYHVHLREKTEVTYKRNGRFLPDGLKKANWALRDWRENKPTNMDPALLDLMWEAYRQSGSRDYIQILGGFRSPKTNNMLRSRSAGVAGGSLHMSGKAIDFYIPDVPLRKMRDIGLRMQIGGVGYYPRSGSPFVHFDSGTGRYWPRMSRKELASIFPKGNTIHVPADGKPLPGYETAMASYKQRKGASGNIQIASASETRRSGGGKTLIARLFGGGADEAEDNAEMEAAPVPRNAPRAPVRQAPPAAAPAPQVQVAAAAPARTPPARAVPMPTGVPMPETPQFDTAARTPAASTAPTPPDAVASVIALASIPLPQPAPVRAAEPPVVAAAAPAVPAAPAPAVNNNRSAGVELAYAVPTPRNRPQFEAVLQQPALAAEAPANSADAIAETILASATSDTDPVADARPLVNNVAFPTPRSSADEAAAEPKPIEVASLQTEEVARTPVEVVATPPAPVAEAAKENVVRSAILAALKSTPMPDSSEPMAADEEFTPESRLSARSERVNDNAEVTLDQRIASRIETAAELTRPLAGNETGKSGRVVTPSMLVINVPVPVKLPRS
ncbi:DUF882 domain-containing protein [Aureimonas fodinaquatilis]|nr:DUF882 domain-containing protein [Aureimonas fodinaquatilis]